MKNTVRIKGWADELQTRFTFDRPPANEQPRFEPRKKWPRDSLCAAPQAPVKSRRGARLELAITFLNGHSQLPIVELKKVA